MEFEIIHGSRLSTVSLSYEDCFRFDKVSQYWYIYAVNYLIFCSCVVFVIMNKVSMNEKISL